MERANKYRGRNSEAGMGFESLQMRTAEEKGAEKAQLSVPLQCLRMLAFVAVTVLCTLRSPLF